MADRVAASSTREAAGVAADQHATAPSSRHQAKTNLKKSRATKTTEASSKKKRSGSKGMRASRSKAKDPQKAMKPTVQPPVASQGLPHNLGISLTSTPATETNAADKENYPINITALLEGTPARTDHERIVATPSEATNNEPNVTPKKVTYKHTQGVSPFPKFSHPFVSECNEVNHLLSSFHGEVIAPKVIPEPSLTVTGCGEVPSVLDALIRTLLSSATSSTNSANAFKGLVARFGVLGEGIGKGSVNWDAVRQASLKDVFDAIKSGGLADSKSKNIKAILDMVYQENQDRRNIILSSQKSDAPDCDHELVCTEKAKEDKQYEIDCADQHILSLNHLHRLSTENVMNELVKYPGIGPKTAACVLLFCLQRPCFAVDTHIFRICKWLGWLPKTRVDEITAFRHLDRRIPDHLKYSLHQLFIRHGRECVRCKANTSDQTPGWDNGCVIDHLVTRKKTRDAIRSPSKATRGQSKRGVKRKAESLQENPEVTKEQMEVNNEPKPIKKSKTTSAEKSKSARSKASKKSTSKSTKAGKKPSTPQSVAPIKKAISSTPVAPLPKKPALKQMGSVSSPGTKKHARFEFYDDDSDTSELSILSDSLFVDCPEW